jgi:hypothetical protein
MQDFGAGIGPDKLLLPDNLYFCNSTTFHLMKRFREMYEKYKNYSLDVIMYGFFIIFILILFLFFS